MKKKNTYRTRSLFTPWSFIWLLAKYICQRQVLPKQCKFRTFFVHLDIQFTCRCIALRNFLSLTTLDTSYSLAFIAVQYFIHLTQQSIAIVSFDIFTAHKPSFPFAVFMQSHVILVSTRPICYVFLQGSGPCVLL